MANPIVTFEMENGDIIKAELYPDIAPNTVNNFISLVNKEFYNGLIFHRVISGFMIQGAVQMGRSLMHDKELGAGGIRMHGAGHGQDTGGVLQIIFETIL